MALMGKGDDRWIVEEREDGANVNQWHWSEKDCMRWTEHRFAQLLNGMLLTSNGTCEASIIDIASITGDAILNQRKKKLIPMYELEVKANFTGTVKDSAGSLNEVKGKIVLPYIADENHDEDTEVTVSLEDEDSNSKQLKATILADGKQKLVDAVKLFVADFRAGVPAGHTAEKATAPKEETKPKKVEAAPKKSTEKTMKGSTKRGVNTIVIKETFYAGAKEIYDVFTNEQRVKAFTQSEASMTAEVGGEFTMFGGSIVGIFRELIPNTKIVQDWRFSTWDDDLYSQVTIDISEADTGTTKVVVTQEGIPHEDKHGNHNVVLTTENGWRTLILHRIKAVFGYGV